MSDKDTTGSVFDMFQKFGENLKLPTPEIDDMVNYHRKNIQALQDAVQTTSTGTQAIMAKQREQLEGALGEISELVQGFTATSNPSDKASNQVEFAKRSFETTIQNASEIGSMARDTGTDSFNILKDRVQESAQEIRDTIEKKA